MAEVKVLNAEGQEVGKISLPSEIFEVEPNKDLIFRYIHKQLADARSGNASTKTKAEVSGGGRKPWRQKHTGRARAGSTRSPIWRHGGVSFGPRPRDWSEGLNKKMKAGAIKSALSSKLSEEKLVVVEKFEMDAPKTREFADTLKKVVPAANAFFVLDTRSNEKQNNVRLSAKNLRGVKVVIADNSGKEKTNVDGLNVFDMMKYEWLVLTRRTVEKIVEVYKDGE